MSDRVYTVYEIIGPDGVYIGATGQRVERRWTQHVSGGRGQTSRRLYEALALHGRDAFTYRALVQTRDVGAAAELEHAFVADRRAGGLNLYNASRGGEVIRSRAEPKPRIRRVCCCSLCGGAGHTKRTCMHAHGAVALAVEPYELPPPPEPRVKRVYRCSVCDSTGHKSSQCPVFVPGSGPGIAWLDRRRVLRRDHARRSRGHAQPLRILSCSVCGERGHNRRSCRAAQQGAA